MFGKIVLGATLVATGALRNRRQATQMIMDVPVHNYNLRHLQYEDLEDGVPTGPFSMLHLQDEEQSRDYEFDWVVVFKEGTSDQSVDYFCANKCKAMGHPEKGVRFATVTSTEAGLEELMKQHVGEVDFIEPDLPVFSIPEMPTESVVEENSYWFLDLMGKSKGQRTGKNVHIYVMDTGIRSTHQDFGGRVVPTVDTIAGGGTALECDADDVSCAADTNGHGTHVAGSTAGGTFGVATDAIIHAMRVCCGAGTNTLAGMDFIATKGEKPAIMTMSLGSYGQSQSAKVAVDTLVNGGVTVFVSAGNNDIDSCGKTYAFIPNAIAVGASDSNDRRAWFSNWGACNDIYAPGVGIISASHLSDTESRPLSGTSMATPLAAGVGALLLEANPTMSPATLRAQLFKNAVSGVLTDLKGGDPDLRVNIA